MTPRTAPPSTTQTNPNKPQLIPGIWHPQKLWNTRFRDTEESWGFEYVEPRRLPLLCVGIVFLAEQSAAEAHRPDKLGVNHHSLGSAYAQSESHEL